MGDPLVDDIAKPDRRNSTYRLENIWKFSMDVFGFLAGLASIFSYFSYTAKSTPAALLFVCLGLFAAWILARVALNVIDNIVERRIDAQVELINGGVKNEFKKLEKKLVQASTSALESAIAETAEKQISKTLGQIIQDGIHQAMGTRKEGPNVLQLIHRTEDSNVYFSKIAAKKVIDLCDQSQKTAEKQQAFDTDVKNVEEIIKINRAG